MSKMKQAGIKAVNTRRLNKLTDKNRPVLIQLHNEITALENHYQEDWTTEGIIAREIQQTTLTSFKRFGDSKRLSASIFLHWIRKEGTPLDEQCYWITENYGKEIHPDELAAFIMNYESGKSNYFRELNQKLKLFKEIAGFNYCSHFMKKQIVNLEKYPTNDEMPF